MIYSTKRRIILSTHHAIYIFETENIIRCESVGNYTRFFLKNHKPILIQHTLKALEKKLSELHPFIRVHNSHLINLTNISMYLKKEEQLKMVDESFVPVSQRRKNKLMERIVGAEF